MVLAQLLALVFSVLIFSPALPVESQEGCADVSPDTGQPVFFQRDQSCGLGRGCEGPPHRLTWGLSTRPVTYGQPLLVVLWIQNPNDEPVDVWSCADIDWFWIDEVELLDSEGRHITSRREERDLAERKRNPKYAGLVLHACTANAPITVPAHACMHGSFSKRDYTFVRDLNEYYAVPPGHYSLLLHPKESVGQFSRTNIKLPITVLKQ